MSTLVATAEPSSSPPRVLLSATGAPVGDLPVVRVAVDGSTTLLPSAVKVTSGGAGQAFDYRAPFGEPVRYETVETAPATSGTVVLDVSVPWLVHPYQPTLSMAVSGASTREPAFLAGTLTSTAMPSTTTLLEPLGRDDPIAVRVGRRRASSSQLVVRTTTLGQATSLQQLVDDDAPLLLLVHPSRGWGLPFGGVWLQVGDVQVTRRPVVTDPVRTWVLPFRVVAEPVGELRAEWTSGDVLADFDSSLSAERAYVTAGDMEIDLRRTA